MKLILLEDVTGKRREICELPRSLLSSRNGLVNFFRLHAGRVFGGREGKDWRVCVQPRCLCPVSVNQTIWNESYREMDYGMQLVGE